MSSFIMVDDNVNVSKAFSSRKFSELLGNNYIDPRINNGETHYRDAMAKNFSPTKKSKKVA